MSQPLVKTLLCVVIVFVGDSLQVYKQVILPTCPFTKKSLYQDFEDACIKDKVEFYQITNVFSLFFLHPSPSGHVYCQDIPSDDPDEIRCPYNHKSLSTVYP